jgi:hypothetical protein
LILTRNLMIRLQERAHALYQAPDAIFGSQIRFFTNWLQAEPFFATTLEALPRPNATAEDWLREHVQWGHSLRLSDDEAEAAGELWLVLRHMAAQPNTEDATFQIVSDFVHGSGATTSDHNRAFLEIFVDPLIGFLKEKILKDDLLLHSLERYAREASWFRRDELRADYEADTNRGEETLDRDLRWHLFRDGIDFPFSQTRIPSGRPDIVVPDEEAEPLPLEVKVFDPDRGRDASWVRSGFAQAIEYAHDYRRADGYLGVFDISTEGLAVTSDDPSGHLPFIRSSGVTIFIVVVPIGDAQPASGRGRARRTTLDSQFMTST